MQKIFEKIIEKLEENQTIVFRLQGGKPTQSIDLVKAIEIVEQEAEQYNNGWIPCSERLPDYGESVLVSFNKAIQPLIATLYENDTWNMLQGVNGLVDITNDVIAWQPLPNPYQPKGE